MCVRRFPLESVEHQQWASQSTRPGVASFVKIMLVHMDILPLLTPMVDTCRGLVYLFLVFRNRRSSAALLRIFQKWGCSSASQQNTRPKTFSPVTSQACLAHWLKEVNKKGQNKVNHEGEQKQRLYMSLHMCGNERVYTCLHKYTYIERAERERSETHSPRREGQNLIRAHECRCSHNDWVRLGVWLWHPRAWAVRDIYIGVVHVNVTTNLDCSTISYISHLDSGPVHLEVGRA